MIEMTPAAAEVIREVLTGKSLLSKSGLRLSLLPGNEIHAQVADEPERGDEVVSSDSGDRVFVAPEAARYLDDKVLDVSREDAGERTFVGTAKR